MFVGNIVIFCALIYLAAGLSCAYHTLMCFLVRRLVGLQERPPPFEFILVRHASSFMWLAVAMFFRDGTSS